MNPLLAGVPPFAQPEAARAYMRPRAEAARRYVLRQPATPEERQVPEFARVVPPFALLHPTR